MDPDTSRLDRAEPPAAFERRTARAEPPGFLRERRMVDRVQSLNVLLRWLTTIIGGAIALTQSQTGRPAMVVAFVLAFGVAVWRTVAPERQASRGAAVRFAIEATALVAVILLSGAWSSPFAFVPVAAVLSAALTFGWPGALAMASGCWLSVTAVAIAPGSTSAGDGQMVEFAVVYGLVGICGALVYRSAQEQAERFEATRDDQARLAAANDLFAALHGVASNLSAPLDLAEVVSTARVRCRELRADRVSLVLADTGGGWRTEFADGVGIPASHAGSDLPPLVAAALTAKEPVIANDLAQAGTNAWSPVSRSAIAVALRARDRVLGVLVVEFDDIDRISPDDAIWLGGLARNLALSIDNAQWFSRLRSLGAEAERNRLARDLHDRLAQSLAYVAIELERIDRKNGGGTELDRLCGVVRDVVAELRSTLYELRVTPTEERSLVSVLQEYANRFTERTGITVTLRVQEELARFARPIEVELWRILQESLTNVERHAGATRAWVSVTSSGDRAIVEVRDNGKGFRPAIVSQDRFGLLGMRERADAINAHLTIDSEPGAGTCVRVEVEVPQ